MSWIHVTCVGTACVDQNYAADYSFLKKHNLSKGLVVILDRNRLQLMTDALGQAQASAGGPAANVAAGIALHGGNAAMIGKVANDTSGRFFTNRMHNMNVEFTPIIASDAAEGTSTILVVRTPDKERTFGAYCGAGHTMQPDELDFGVIEKAQITYLDSYLWLLRDGETIASLATITAKTAGKRVALGLNDKRLVTQNRQSFQKLLNAGVDIIVGDIEEVGALFGTTTHATTLEAVAAAGLTASLTMGPNGSYAVEAGNVTHIPAIEVAEIVDTCGAGDQFAAGFLYGLSLHKPASQSAELGAKWASTIIQHVGAEPKSPTLTNGIDQPAPTL